MENLPKIPPMLFQAVEQLQEKASDPIKEKHSPELGGKTYKFRLLTSLVGIGMGVVATQWLTLLGPATAIGAVVIIAGLLVRFLH